MFFDYPWQCGRCLEWIEAYENHDMGACPLHPNVRPYEAPPPMFSHNPAIEGFLSFIVGIGTCLGIAWIMVRFFL
jgi:hypothetical protein